MTLDLSAEIIRQHACEIDGGCEEAAEALAAAGLLATDEMTAVLDEVVRQHARGYDNRHHNLLSAAVNAYLASRGEQ